MKRIIFAVLILFIVSSCNEQDIIKALLNNEFYSEYGFAGSNFRLIKMGKEYYVDRTMLGSGVYEVGTIRYFVEIIDNDTIRLAYKNELNKDGLVMPLDEDDTTIKIEDDKIYLIVNGIKYTINKMP